MSPGETIRRYRRIGFASLAISLFICAGMAFGAKLSTGLLTVAFLPPFIVLIALWILEPDAKETLREAEYRVCPGCLYDLVNLPPAGTCPECGRPYTSDSLRHHWRQHFERSRRRPTKKPVEQIVIRSLNPETRGPDHP